MPVGALENGITGVIEMVVTRSLGLGGSVGDAIRRKGKGAYWTVV